MTFRIEYLFTPREPTTECWTILPFTRDLTLALQLAHDGLPDVKDLFDAKGFWILDHAGNVIAEEWGA